MHVADPGTTSSFRVRWILLSWVEKPLCQQTALTVVALCKTIVSAIVSVFDGLTVWQFDGLGSLGPGSFRRALARLLAYE